MKWVPSIGLLLMYNMVFAQALPEFRQLRYDEDYSSLRTDSSRTGYRSWKYIPLSKQGNSYLSIGGETRWQYFFIRNEGWGDVAKDSNGYWLNRNLLHLDLRFNERMRLFTQLQSAFSISRIDASPIDENPLELHQAFADIEIGQRDQHTLVIRAGRQEMLYGSQRLISVREGPNNRQSFDAIKLLTTTDRHRVDIFYGYYVSARAGAFNDRPGTNTGLWGIYAVQKKIIGNINIDFYYLGIRRASASYDDITGKEKRHSAGFRWWTNTGNWQYDFEAVYQFGSVAKSRIHAWTTSINMRYQFENARSKPAIGLKSELISGDKKYDDGRIQTFNPLFPRGAYFGLAALIGPANLMDIHPSFSVSPGKWELNMDYDVFWRQRLNDGIYAVNTQLLYSGKASANKYIGGQWSTSASYNGSRFFSVTAECTYFRAGRYLKDVSAGKNILFAGITAQLKF